MKSNCKWLKSLLVTVVVVPITIFTARTLPAAFTTPKPLISVEINGTDYTLYLVFLRYAAFLCSVITMFNAVLMVPLYASGAPSQLDKE